MRQERMGTSPGLPCSALKRTEIGNVPSLLALTGDNEEETGFLFVSLFALEVLYVFRNMRCRGHVDSPTGVPGQC
jgi:hypothetical protein